VIVPQALRRGITWASANQNALEESSGFSREGVSGDLQVTALRDAFLKPAESAKPMTRWWWFGGAITPKEITSELTSMRDAGIRGVELQPVYPLEIDDPKRGVRNIRYFSPEWYDLLRHTTAETRRLGLQFDVTLGSGWPFGGPFIPQGQSARRLRVLTHNFGGPGEFSWDLSPEIPFVWDDKIVAVLAAPILPTGQPDLGQVRIITDQVKPKIIRNAGLGHQIQRWKAPAGLWVIMVFLNSPLHELVRRPTLGMEGYAVDRLSRKATDLFLSAAGTQIVNELKSIADPPFHSVFCDSEAPSADWTANFIEEFQRRRGYDLTPFLPALWMDSGPLTPHIRYDFHVTLSGSNAGQFLPPPRRVG
jgi:alpha-L-rhamnosidase